MAMSTLQEQPATSDSLSALASAVMLQLETDHTCPGFVKRIFRDSSDVLYALDKSKVTFLPGLLDLLVTGTPPSVATFDGLSLPLKKGYGLYVLVLRKWIGDAFTGEWHYDFRLYLGSGTKKDAGIPSRFKNYDRDELYAVFVADAIHFGWTVAHRCIIAWAPLVESTRHHHLRLLFLILEATLSHAYAMHDHDQMKSMEKAFWNPATLDYEGLCYGSALRETYNIQKFFERTEEELRADEEAKLRADEEAKPKRKAREATAEFIAKRKEKRNSAEEKLKRKAKDKGRSAEAKLKRKAKEATAESKAKRRAKEATAESQAKRRATAAKRATAESKRMAQPGKKEEKAAQAAARYKAKREAKVAGEN